MDEEMHEEAVDSSGCRDHVHTNQDVKMTEDSGGTRKCEEEEADRVEGLGLSGEEDPLCPRYTFSAEEHKQDCEKWKKALITKMLGKRIEFKFLLARLQRIWNLVSSYEAIDLDNGFLLLRFQDDGDYRHVLEEGPWIVNDHYVVVQRWRPLFDPYDDSVKKLAVWVRIPRLPIELYTIRHLWRIGNIFGRTLKVDRNSLRKSELGDDVITVRARFARICVEVDLRRTFLPKFWIGSKVYQVGYEGLHLICFKCGVYGHRKDQCLVAQVPCAQHDLEIPVQEVTEGVVPEPKVIKAEEAFGDLIVIQRQPKSKKLKAKPLSSGKGVMVEQKQNSELGDPSPNGMVTKISLNGEVVGMESMDCMGQTPMEVGCLASSVVVEENLVAATNVVVASSSPQKKGRSPKKDTKKFVGKEGKDRAKTGTKSQKKQGVENVPPISTPDGSAKGQAKTKSRSLEVHTPGGGIGNTISRKDFNGVLFSAVYTNSGLVGIKAEVNSSVLAWNCRGVGKSSFPTLIKDLKFRFKVSILALFEVKVGGSRGDEIIRKLGFPNFFRQDPVGFSGGIWLLWEGNLVDVEVLDFNHQYIHTRVIHLESLNSETMTFAYGSPRRLERKSLWSDLEAFSAGISGPWLILGDFNAILKASKKTGGKDLCYKSMEEFNQCLIDCEINDLGHKGPDYTWKRGRLHERLDRMCSNEA
ncbi:uncharacterized protein LOC133303193 [Gastrolobium bilobum]|uniref:uncharacterized protein LOC133303193 n=1 Tax=Gastrolobium bilobum TaxID=150636 RepID=UPI002AB2D21A|nr:uncharacterized protein LOC133303193 [Gastrolobium bilobum]